jgi:hypothetical protein
MTPTTDWPSTLLDLIAAISHAVERHGVEGQLRVLRGEDAGEDCYAITLLIPVAKLAGAPPSPPKRPSPTPPAGKTRRKRGA